MGEIEQVQAMQKKIGLVIALKTEGGKAIVDDLASRLASRIERMILQPGTTDELINSLYEVRGIASLLGDVGFDVRSVIDQAARNIAKQQLHLTQPPTIRRRDESDTEGEAQDRQ